MKSYKPFENKATPTSTTTTFRHSSTMSSTWTTVQGSGAKHYSKMPRSKQGSSWRSSPGHRGQKTQKRDLSSQLYFLVKKMYAEKSAWDFVNWVVNVTVPMTNWECIDGTWFYYAPDGQVTVFPETTPAKDERPMEPQHIPIVYAVHELARSDSKDSQEAFKRLEDKLRERDEQFPWTAVINTINGNQGYSPLCRALWHGNYNIESTLLSMGANVGFENSHGEGLDAALNHGRQTAAELQATKRQMWALERQSQRSGEEEDLLRRLRDADRKGYPMEGIKVQECDLLAVSDKYDRCETQLRNRQEALRREKARQQLEIKKLRLSVLEAMSEDQRSVDEELEFQSLRSELVVSAPKRWVPRHRRQVNPPPVEKEVGDGWGEGEGAGEGGSDGW